MPVNFRKNPWSGADESSRIIGESHTVPTGSTVRPGSPENEIKLAEVPRQDVPYSLRCYQAGSPTSASLTKAVQVYEGTPSSNLDSLAYCQTGRDGVGLHYRYRTLLGLASMSGLPTLVDAVTLRLYLNSQSSAGYPGERTIGVHALQAAFTENTVTWANAPAHNLVAAAAFNVTLTGFYDVDITSIYQNWVSTGNAYGCLLKDGNDPATDTIRQFASDTESVTARRPSLIIDEVGDTFNVVEANVTPGPMQVAINWDLGLARFNNADIGKNVLFDYWGQGSLLWA